jgi:hypothetical protein
MERAVAGWSPVISTGVIPAVRQAATVAAALGPRRTQDRDQSQQPQTVLQLRCRTAAGVQGDVTVAGCHGQNAVAVLREALGTVHRAVDLVCCVERSIRVPGLFETGSGRAGDLQPTGEGGLRQQLTKRVLGGGTGRDCRALRRGDGLRDRPRSRMPTVSEWPTT